jgi:hypothetical protein
MVRCMMRSPVSLTRLRFTPGAKEVVYARKGGHGGSKPGEEGGELSARGSSHNPQAPSAGHSTASTVATPLNRSAIKLKTPPLCRARVGHAN